MSRGMVARGGLAAALALAAGPVAAQPVPPVAMQVAPGEVLLEAGGYGLARTPADLGTLEVPIRAEGATEVAARRAFEAQQRRVVDAAVRAGVARADIVPESPPKIERDEADTLTDLDAEEPAASERRAEPPVFRASGSVKFRSRNVSRAAAVREAIGNAGVDSVPDFVFSLIDSRAARRQAKTAAVEQARGDAEAYAARLNMRVVRIARISERAATYNLNSIFGLAFDALLGNPRGPLGIVEEYQEGVVVTPAIVDVDFVLAPR